MQGNVAAASASCELQTFGQFTARNNTVAQQQRPFSDFITIDPNLPGYCRWDECSICHHFPHAAQYLYSCFSYWNQESKESQPRVLVTNYVGKNPRWPNGRLPWPFHLDFNHGLVLELYQHFGVRIVANQTGGARPRVRQSLPFAMKNPVADTESLRNILVPQKKVHQVDCNAPRIVVLNRKGNNRRITNIHSVLEQLSSSWPKIKTDAFDGVPYHEQFRRMANTDIVLTPHGAQLTSMIVMPRCGAVLELFPTGYFIPNFFGSLADVASIRHYTAYHGVNATAEMARTTRGSARGVDICPDPQGLKAMLDTMLEEWHGCCLEWTR